MKTLVTGMLLALSMNSYATDFGKYCLKFLNGESSEKPAMLTDFKMKEKEILINGKKVQTIDFEYVGEVGFISKTETDYVAKDRSETQKITVSVRNKKGKDIKDYTLIVKRDLDGNVVEVKKANTILDMKLNDKLSFVTKNGVCMPDELHHGPRRKFSSSMCRELEEFFQSNPEARSCMEKNFDIKIQAIVAKHSEGIPGSIFSPKRFAGSMLAGKALGDCSESGLIPMIEDNAAWGSISTPSKEEEDDGDVKED